MFNYGNGKHNPMENVKLYRNVKKASGREEEVHVHKKFKSNVYILPLDGFFFQYFLSLTEIKLQGRRKKIVPEC